MVLTPKDVLELTQAEKDLVSRLESEIDAALQEGFRQRTNGTHTRCVYYPLPEKVTSRVLYTIQQMYQSAGWKVSKEVKRHEVSEFLCFGLG